MTLAIASTAKNHPIIIFFLCSLRLGCEMLTKLRVGSHSKQFANR